MRRASGNVRPIRGGVNAVRFPSAGGAVWVPTDIASVNHWYRADLGVTDSSGVSAWLDQVGTAHANDPGAGNRPTYSASDADINGRASVSFDGSNDVLTFGVASDWTFLNNGDPSTFWAVFRIIANGDHAIVNNNNISGANAGFFIYNQGTGQAIYRVTPGANAAALWSYTSTALSANTNYHTMILQTGTDYAVRRNSAELSTGAYTGTPAANDPPSPITFAKQSGAADYYAYKLLEFGTATDDIAGADLTALEAYLDEYYAI